MLVGDMRGKWRECDPYLTDEMISSVPPAEATPKSSTQVCAGPFNLQQLLLV